MRYLSFHIVLFLVTNSFTFMYHIAIMYGIQLGFESQILKKNLKNSIIKISVDYSIVTQFTSFVAIEKREKDEDLSKKSGPSILELVGKETVDALDYMGWEGKEEEDSSAESSKVSNILYLHFKLRLYIQHTS